METWIKIRPKDATEPVVLFKITGVPKELANGDQFHIKLFEETGVNCSACVEFRHWQPNKGRVTISCFTLIHQIKKLIEMGEETEKGGGEYILLPQKWE